MVSNDLWKYVHLRLQEIKQCKEPFGGVNIIAIGDMYQLQPVKANYVFMDLQHNYGPLATNLWCEYITMYELDEIMWQKDDRQFAELLNRFRIGQHTSADLNLLATHSITAEEAKSLNHVPHFFPTRQKVDQYNENVLQNSTCQKVIITAIDIPPSGSSPKFKQQLQAALDKRKPESTGGLPKVITVAVNHQYDIISNIAVQDGIMNGAECCIKYIQPQAQDRLSQQLCWCNLKIHMLANYNGKNTVIYKIHTYSQDWTPIFAQKRSFLIKDVWVTRVQFPMHNAAAHTIHVAQSATFRQIYIDMSTNTTPPKTLVAAHALRCLK